MKKIPFLSLILAGLSAQAMAQLNDANSLYGIHWYANPNDIASSDADVMLQGNESWILEITHVDAAAAPPWDLPSWWQGNYNGPAIDGKGHSLVYRIQPYWDRNVPHPSDPFTLTDFANGAAAAADTMKSHVRFWQVGNEVNLNGENRHWNGVDGYTVIWTPDPADYAATYLAVRDAIHTVTPQFTVPQQVVLMQPVSPGNVIPGVRFMDGNEFLWRQIEAIPEADRDRIDGFALHAYAEPGGANFGFDGFMESLREQIMIIDQFGLHDRPLIITEFNKHMPNATEAAIGARFVQQAFTGLHAWNTGTGGAWPGLANHQIVGACWFVFRTDGGTWQDYSLQDQKVLIPGDDPNTDPWWGFHAAATNNYPAGSLSGGGGEVDHGATWWTDNFDTLDTTAPLPRWRVETTGSGSATASGSGTVRLLGSGTDGGATLRTAGYVYGDFRLELDFEITNAARPAGSANTAESNFDIRIREGSRGYSLTFFTSASDATRRNRVILRRTNEWSTIGSFNQEIGITSGDRFRVVALAGGETIRYEIYKNDAIAPVVDWTVNDGGQRVGWIRAGSYNLAEARIDRVSVGGTQSVLLAENWELY